MDAPESPVALTGLTDAEAAARLAADGPNQLASGGREPLLAIVRDVLREPMLLFLIAAGLLYLLLGDAHEALILTAFAGLTIAIAVAQEVRSDRAIAALGELAMPQASLIRDGRRLAVAAREVVRGDLLVLEEGGRIVADGWIVSAHDLTIDEAVLTGESVPVAKAVAKDGSKGSIAPVPGGEVGSYAWAGTLVVRGTGLVEVAATGPRTAIGAIGQSLGALGKEPSRLAVQSRWLVRWFAICGLAVSALAVVLFALLRGSWLDGLLSGIAVAMSLMPEELPVVLTLFMTMGALRMARARVLARRGAAIETLGAVTVLCTDKTGTLTENRMEVEELRIPSGETFRPGMDPAPFPEEFRHLARAGILACPEDPFDPMEQAFHSLARTHAAAELNDRQQAGWSLRHRYALSPELLAVSHVWGTEAQDARLVAAKGAPEAIAELCGLAAAEAQALEAQAAQMAERGLRVLGVATAPWSGGDLPQSQRHFAFALAGLVGLADPVRASVPGAVSNLQAAGIRVVMITGDYPTTARAIAEAAGISAGETITGDVVAAMDDAEMARRIAGATVFARVMPAQKLRIVTALKASGEVVAMIGDGVNDAPSLKAAHVGVAMGQRGTDVAREAAALVLLDDDFEAVPAAVRLGRRIYDNIRKAAGFIFAVHLPIAGLAIAPLLTGWPLIIGPVHVALLELVIDPVCTLAYEAEPEEQGLMQRPPRSPDSPLISRVLAGWAAVQGGLVLAVLLGLAAWAIRSGANEGTYRTIVFAGLIVAVLALVAANRTFRAGTDRRAGRNLALAAIAGVAVPLFALLFLQRRFAVVFGFLPLDRAGAMAVALTGLVLVLALHGIKRALRGALAS